jgi:hypothetical protein
LHASTIGQNEASCVIYGMPKAANECGATEIELPIGKFLSRRSIAAARQRNVACAYDMFGLIRKRRDIVTTPVVPPPAPRAWVDVGGEPDLFACAAVATLDVARGHAAAGDPDVGGRDHANIRLRRS